MRILKNFIVPVILGILLGGYLKYVDGVEGIRGIYTFSSMILFIIECMVPLLIFTFISSSLMDIKKGIGRFLLKYLFYLLTTLIICGFLTYGVAYLTVSRLITKVDIGIGERLVSYIIFPRVPKEYMLVSLLGGFLLPLLSNKVDGIRKGIKTLEGGLIYFLKNIFMRILPLWVASSFVVLTYQSNMKTVIKTDLYLSFIVILLQITWLLLNYLIGSRFSIGRLKEVVRGSSRIYLHVLSINGMGSGVLIPKIVEEQKKLGLSEEKSKFISATSFNMPGSLISNIVFTYGVATLYGYNLSLVDMSIYILVLILTLILAPAVPGGVFALTSRLLMPYLGFTEGMVNLTGSLYFRQGTSNSAINNCSDFYMGLYLDEKRK